MFRIQIIVRKQGVIVYALANAAKALFPYVKVASLTQL